MKRRSPKLKSNEDVERFLDRDLSDCLIDANLTPVTFEFQPKERVVNLRISTGLLDKVKQAAKKQNMPYQKYIRQTLELSLER